MSNYNEDIKYLEKFLNKGKMNENLKEALTVIKTALENNNRKLACKISTVKSVIESKIDDNDNKPVFQEDSEYNNQEIGMDIYYYLDGLNFKLSYTPENMPEDLDKINHPILDKIEKARGI